MPRQKARRVVINFPTLLATLRSRCPRSSAGSYSWRHPCNSTTLRWDYHASVGTRTCTTQGRLPQADLFYYAKAAMRKQRENQNMKAGVSTISNEVTVLTNGFGCPHGGKCRVIFGSDTAQASERDKELHYWWLSEALQAAVTNNNPPKILKSSSRLHQTIRKLES